MGDAIHFLVLLIPNSINRPWVNTESDAGLIQKIEDGRKFIPLRVNVEPSALSPLLRTLHAPELKDFDRDVQQLINDIYGVARKPPLGAAPPVTQHGRVGRFSGAAAAVADEHYEISLSTHRDLGGSVWTSRILEKISPRDRRPAWTRGVAQ